MRTQQIEIPMPLPSAANLRENRLAKMRRVRSQRSVVQHVLRSQLSAPHPPCIVTLCRVAARPLDSDNWVYAAKAPRDGVADWLCVDDGDPRITWLYEQARPAKSERHRQVLRITIESPEDETCAN